MGRMKDWAMQISESMGLGGNITPAVIRRCHEIMAEIVCQHGAEPCPVCQMSGIADIIDAVPIVCWRCGGSGKLHLESQKGD
jgi:hypothetical protein